MCQVVQINRCMTLTYLTINCHAHSKSCWPFADQLMLSFHLRHCFTWCRYAFWRENGCAWLNSKSKHWIDRWLNHCTNQNSAWTYSKQLKEKHFRWFLWHIDTQTDTHIVHLLCYRAKRNLTTKQLELSK